MLQQVSDIRIAIECFECRNKLLNGFPGLFFVLLMDVRYKLPLLSPVRSLPIGENRVAEQTLEPPSFGISDESELLLDPAIRL